MTLNVGQVDRRPLDHMVTLFGGKVYLNHSRSRTGPIHDYKLHGANAARALELMAPFMKVKQEQANLAVEFQSLQQTNMRRTAIDPAVAERKATIAAELKRLKRITT